MKNKIKDFLQNRGILINKFDITSLDDDRFYQNYLRESLKHKRFYNIGAGSFKHKFWTNIDYSTDHYKNMQSSDMLHHNLMDLSDIPLENNSAEIIYSSHTIEHISDSAVIKMLSESYRILKPNGVIRLTTPNFKVYYDAYKNNDIYMWDWDINRYSKKGHFEKNYTKPLNKASIEQIFLFQFASQLSEISKDNSVLKKYSDQEIKKIFEEKNMESAFNYFTSKCNFNSNYPGYHINWFTIEKLERLLKEAGFCEIKQSAFGQSSCTPLRNTVYFDNTHPKYSLYIEAKK